jgi:hypothetical protein
MAPNTKIIFPDGITYLDSFCIQTNNITEVEIPASVSTINADGLADMSNLKIVKIHRTSSVYPYADADKTGYLSTLPFGL